MSYAYISYHPVSHLTRNIANELSNILAMNQVKINHYRHGSKPGYRDRDIAENDIKHACCVVVVCTNRLRISPWYEMDIKLAEQFKKPIIPLLTDGKAENTLPLALQTKANLARLIDRTQDKSFDQVVARLVEAIKVELAAQQPPVYHPPRHRRHALKKLPVQAQRSLAGSLRCSLWIMSATESCMSKCRTRCPCAGWFRCWLPDSICRSQGLMAFRLSMRSSTTARINGSVPMTP